jgi:hypothetical protein
MTDERLRLIRNALQAVLATHKGTSKAAQDAVQLGRDAYRLCFTEAERSKVLEDAQRIQREAPAGHFLRITPQIMSFEQALDEMGTQLIDQVLGSAVVA